MADHNKQQQPESTHSGQQPHRESGRVPAEGQQMRGDADFEQERMPPWLQPVMNKAESFFKRWQDKTQAETTIRHILMISGNVCVMVICLAALYLVGLSVERGNDGWPMWLFASIDVGACVTAISMISRQLRKEDERRITEKEHAAKENGGD